MIVSELVRGLAIAVVVVLVMLRHPSLELLIGLVVVAEVLGVFSALSERRLICSLVEPDNTASALASAEARTHLVVLTGRSLGAFLFGLGQALPFLADAASFVGSTTVLMHITQRRPHQPEQSIGRHLGREVGDGLRWVRSDYFARIAFPLTACTTLIGQALIMVFLAKAHESSLPSDQIGLILAASGAGGALGSAAASWFFQRFKYALLSVQMWIWTVMFAILAFFGGRQSALMAVTLTVIGFSGALGNITLDTYMLRQVNERMLARATSIARLTSFGGLALGPLLGGVLVERYGVAHSIFVLFLAVTLLSIVAAAATMRGRQARVIPTERFVPPAHLDRAHGHIGRGAPTSPQAYPAAGEPLPPRRPSPKAKPTGSVVANRPKS
jgi:predicted MFS family arabinose efflux permease